MNPAHPLVSLTEAQEPDGFGENPNLGSIITAADGNVLPRLNMMALVDALRRLPPDELTLSLRSKLVPLVSVPGLKLFAACGPPALDTARHDGLKVIAYAEAAEFIAAARLAHGPELLRAATRGLAERQPDVSASRRFSAAQLATTLLLVLVLAVGAMLLPVQASWAAASAIAGLFFLSMIALRILCLMPPVRNGRIRPLPLSGEELPVYSVLVPLFRETSVLRQLLRALTRLSYPEDKLDIKLILEEEDILMQRAVAGLQLPPQFDVIVVPSGWPQTKPRALNYALAFCRGNLLTIFDAEDVPEPMQLRRAAEHFAARPRKLACLQAQLLFYNPNENWLARQFTIEYAALFGMLLPMLANHHLPLLLGGTSNHFRTEILREVGGWDPYNVTEDADLGLRLARHGYDIGTFDSRTYEEANIRLGNWMRQRARWLKGFLLTWLVHMRSPAIFWREVGPSGFWVAQAMTLGVFASALLHPLCVAGTVVLLIVEPPPPPDAGLITIGLAGLSVLILVAGYVTAMMVGARALRREAMAGWYLPIATMPLYWLLMSVAAWYALWQFAIAPFHWNKTEHGLSFMQRRGRQEGRKVRPNPSVPRP